MISALDTNIVSAIWSKEPGWTQVLEALNRAADQGGLLLCGVVYAELLAHPRTTEGLLTGFVEKTGIRTDFAFGEDIWREAGLRFGAYAERRRREAHPKSPAPDDCGLHDWGSRAASSRQADYLGPRAICT